MTRLLLLLALLFGAISPTLARELPAPTVERGEDRWGGHTVERHVGRTDEQLRARLARDSRLDTASSFDSLEIATRVIEQTLAENGPRLVSWLARVQPGSRRTLDHHGTTRIGRAVRAEEPRQVIVMTNARLVIEALGQGRWRLITAYPSF